MIRIFSRKQVLFFEILCHSCAGGPSWRNNNSSVALWPDPGRDVLGVLWLWVEGFAPSCPPTQYGPSFRTETSWNDTTLLWKSFLFLKSPEFALLCASTSLSAPHLLRWGHLTFVPLSRPVLNVQWHVVDMSSGWHHVDHVILTPRWFYSILSTSSLLKPQGEVTGEADQKGEKRKLDPLNLLCSSRIWQVTLTRTGWNIN